MNDISAAGSEQTPILMVTENFPPASGGSGVLFNELYSRLPGFDVTVLTRDVAEAPVARDSALRVIRELQPLRKWGLSSLAGLLGHLRLARQVRGMARAGEVHCGRTLPEGVSAWLASLAGGPGYSCWVHGEDVAMQLSQSREYRWLTERVCRRATRIFANSHNSARLLGSVRIDPARVTVIHPGVDPARFRPDLDGTGIRSRYEAQGPLLLSVGRLQRRKGFDTALRAVARVQSDYPGLRYLLVGRGEDESYLRGLIGELGLQDTAHLVGAVSDEELPLFYAACDVFLHPNRVEGVDIEGFGIVFLEAAASGVPVVGGRSGGVPEAVEDRETGLLVEGQDVGELESVLRELLGSQSLRDRLGRAGRARVERSFTWERAASSLCRALEPGRQ